MFHWYTYSMMALAGSSAVASIVSFIARGAENAQIKYYSNLLNTRFNPSDMEHAYYMQELGEKFTEEWTPMMEQNAYTWAEGVEAQEKAAAEAALKHYQGNSSLCKWLGVGFGVAAVILTAVSVYLTYRDMVNHYKVEFTPIPRYMVDEKDITAFNRNGEKIVIKNQAAYYKAALCNRKSSDEYYDIVGDVADLNGDVGKQWLAIYYAKNEAEMPVLDNSLKVVTGSGQIPVNYTNGVHMFGTGAAENINNTLYIWNSSARSIYLYYLLDTGSASLAGSGFSAGTVVLSGGTGFAVGALASGLFVKNAGKKRKKEALA